MLPNESITDKQRAVLDVLARHAALLFTPYDSKVQAAVGSPRGAMMVLEGLRRRGLVDHERNYEASADLYGINPDGLKALGR